MIKELFKKPEGVAAKNILEILTTQLQTDFTDCMRTHKIPINEEIENHSHSVKVNNQVYPNVTYAVLCEFSQISSTGKLLIEALSDSMRGCRISIRTPITVTNTDRFNGNENLYSISLRFAVIEDKSASQLMKVSNV